MTSDIDEEGGGPSKSADGSSSKTADTEMDDVDIAADGNGTSATAAGDNNAANPGTETDAWGAAEPILQWCGSMDGTYQHLALFP